MRGRPGLRGVEGEMREEDVRMSEHACGVAKRFWAMVNKHGPIQAHVANIGECWEWTGSRSRLGYGIFSVRGKKRASHRVSWELSRGYVPAGAHVLHACDNRKCVRPSHLFLGTHRDNMRDMVLKGRSRGVSRRGSESNSAVLDEVLASFAKRMLADGVSTREIAMQLGVSRGAILAISTGRTWTHVPWPDGASMSISRSPRARMESRK